MNVWVIIGVVTILTMLLIKSTYITAKRIDEHSDLAGDSTSYTLFLCCLWIAAICWLGSVTMPSLQQTINQQSQCVQKGQQ